DSKELQRPLAHECLGETLRILRQVINKYPLLNTLETLTAAGTLISKVKGFHYESNNESDKREFEKAVETIAVSFSSTVSEFLMGEVDSSTILSIPPSDQNQAMESLYGGIPGPGGDGMPSGMETYDTGKQAEAGCRGWGGVTRPSRAAVRNQHLPHHRRGSEPAVAPRPLQHRGPSRTPAQHGAGTDTGRVTRFLVSQTNMPFLSIYLLALEQDMEHGTSVLQAANTLQHQTFLQPLTVRRLEHEKRRKEIKEQWHRAQRKLQEAEVNLRKAKQIYMQRSEEHEKAKYTAAKAEEEQQNTTSSITTKALDKKRRLEEEAKNKVGRQQLWTRAEPSHSLLYQPKGSPEPWTEPTSPQSLGCGAGSGPKRGELFSLFSLPMDCSPCSPYPWAVLLTHGLFSLFSLPMDCILPSHLLSRSLFSFLLPTRSPFTRTRKGSFNANDFSTNAGSDGAGLPKDGSGSEGGAGAKEQQSGAVVAERRGGRGHQVHKSWPTTTTEADSSLDSNTGEFSHKLQRLSSNGTMSSSEELEEKDENATPFEQSINGITPEMTAPTGPFRNVGLSKAAQTHRLRKLRTPSKCRECNSYVYFQGAECEEGKWGACYLACHKKCLETLAIQCGHKKLQGKLQLFGQDFTKASQGSVDGIPFIIKKCISEIEKRALKTKGIYRVNGVKTRVEKLCQAFENGKELVELSQASPHDISNVLKLYLRQVLWQRCLLLAGRGGLPGGANSPNRTRPHRAVPDGCCAPRVTLRCAQIGAVPLRSPYGGLRWVLCPLGHPAVIVEVEQDNKMTSSNLGIVFGPTLMRPRPTDATISLSSLVDYPHQARIIEALIIFYSTIFE
ncbi:Minor histocompatibility protein HA-1, partial [Egretta garzetta]